MKRKIKNLIHKRRQPKEQASSDGAPRITNETVAAHREEVLSSARKYIYPLQHSKHRIVTISTTLIITSFVVFMTYCLVALYRLQSNSAFLYRVTQVIPFPVAKAGSRFVAYENYLFELRHFIYFYEKQQKLDFQGQGKQQLAEYRKKALEKVINDAYVKELARDRKIGVSDREVDDEITILRRQNRLGGSEQAYEDALRQNFGWSHDDFRRVIRQRLLEQKVVSAMDTATHDKAKTAQAEIKAGADFATVAVKYTDDPAGKGNGGEFPFLVDRASRDISPAITDALFKLKAGEVSDIVNTGYTLEILKAIEVNTDRIKGAHIVFNFQDVSTYINDQKEKHKARAFINP